MFEEQIILTRYLPCIGKLEIREFNREKEYKKFLNKFEEEKEKYLNITLNENDIKECAKYFGIQLRDDNKNRIIKMVDDIMLVNWKRVSLYSHIHNTTVDHLECIPLVKNN